MMQSKLWMIHPTAQTELQKLMAQSAESDQGPKLGPLRPADPLNVVDGVASIPIVGYLLSERDPFLDFFGIDQTAYGDIKAAVLAAEADPSVRAIEFRVDSPGGEAGNAVIDAGDAMFAATKPTTAVVGEMAASAAYWLATQANTIVMSGPASTVGSIGVVVVRGLDSDSVAITSTDAPRKRPDVSTDAGRADVRKWLDDHHSLFVSAVARGRGVTVDTVNEKFGRGGVVLTDEAIRLGMADSSLRASSAAGARVTLAQMDLETLRISHPDVYAQAVAVGASQERGRVSAHLQMGQASGQIAASIEHIAAGLAASDDTVFAAHASAKLAKLGLSDRAADDPATLGANTPEALGAELDRDANIRATFALNGVILDG
jgi:ClpP class serine protease